MNLAASLIFLVSIGCNAQGTPNTPSPTPVLETSTPFPSVTETFSTLVTVTETPTPTRLIPTTHPTSTPTNSPTVTWTPYPTLLPEEAQNRIVGFYTQSNPCELPCWWEIVPGETTWEQVNEQLAPVALDQYHAIGGSGISLHQYTLPTPKGVNFPVSPQEGNFYSYFFDPALFFEDDIVIAISINAGWINWETDYTLAGLLGVLGPPDELWLKLHYSETGDFNPSYNLRLMYNRGVLISTNGEVELQNDLLTICPLDSWNNSSSPSMILWPSSMNIGFQDLESALFGGLRNLYSNDFQLIQYYTDNLDEEAFYNMFSSPIADICLSLPRE